MILHLSLKDLKNGTTDTGTEVSTETGTKPTASSGTVTDTSTQPVATATTPKPFKIEGFDELDDKAFGIIRKYESGEYGFDAVNQGGIKGGTAIPEGWFSGNFSKMSQHGGRKLEDLSIGEIMDLQYDPGKGKMSNSEWVKSGKLHAAGAYQFIAPTFKSEVTAMGLDPSTKFTPQVQSAMAKSHATRLGGIRDSTWIGLKKMTPAERAIINQWNARL